MLSGSERKALARVIASDFSLPGSKKLNDTMRGEVAAEIERQADDGFDSRPRRRCVE
jgi:hypothetical protein